MDYVIVDLEATCWEGENPTAQKEIIEIGAVHLQGPALQPMSDFDQFVQPTENPDLSEFCKQLTHIRQEQVDAAPLFPVAFESFLQWIGGGPFKLCSWGQFDWNLFQAECSRHGRSFPQNLVSHVNLKPIFARAYDTRPAIGLREAMRKLSMNFEGTLHRGIDDARNISRVAQTILMLDE